MSTTVVTKVGTKNADQVVLLDAAGDQVTSFGGGTQYADGTAAATPTGTQINWNDAGTQRAVSAAKPLPVTASIDTTGLATSAKQDTGNTSLSSIDGKITAVNTGAVVVSSSVLPSGAATSAKQDTGNTSLASIDTKLPAQGQALAAASVPVVLTAAQITTLTPVSTVTANLAAGTNNIGDVDVLTLPALPAGTNNIGDVDILSIAAGDNNIGNVDIVSGTITTVTALTGGGIAHDGADSGNPIKVGARATNVEIAAVANNDRSDLVTTLTGKLIVQPYTNPENIVSGVTSAMTGTTSTSVVAAPAAGLRNYITQITVGNSHATVGTFVNIQDGSGGTTIWTIPAAALYGGATIEFDPPLRQPTTATALFCACVTTGSNTVVAANGFKAA